MKIGIGISYFKCCGQQKGDGRDGIHGSGMDRWDGGGSEKWIEWMEGQIDMGWDERVREK